MLKRILSKLRARHATARRPARPRLTVELLESREVLSTWQPGPAFPVDARTLATGVNFNGTILALGGRPFVGTDLKGAAHFLSPGATSWQAGAPLDGPIVSQGSGIDNRGRLIVFGGYEPGIPNVPTSKGFVYDVVEGPRNAIANMPLAATNFAYATDADHRIYAIGGGDGASSTNATYNQRYDGLTDTWTQLAPLPEGRAGAAAVYDGQGHILVIGGFNANSSSRTATAFSYDIASNTWSRIADEPAALSDQAAVLGADGRVYVIGGYSSSSSSPGASTTVFVHDPLNGSWWTGPSLANARALAAVALGNDGNIYVMGGNNNGAGTNTVELLDTDAAEAPVIKTTAPTQAAVGQTYRYAIGATGFPRGSFSLVAAPAGMTIDATKGIITWTPDAGQVGLADVTVRVSNASGSAEQTFQINVLAAPPDLTPPSAPTNLAVTGVTPNSVSLTWTASTDNVAVAGYRVYEQYRYGWRNSRIGYRLVQDNITTTSATVTGLLANTSHKYVVRAYDAAGNISGNSNLVTATTSSAPTLYYSFNGVLNGPVTAVANHLLSLQLGSVANPPATFSLVSGPSGMTVNSTTGLVQWTPSVADIGTTSATFRASNTVGSTDLTVTITVASDLPALSYKINGGTGAQYALAGQEMTIQLSDASATPSTYSIVSGPAAMTIDATTGLARWTPTVADAGNTTVVFRGTNSAGSTDLTVKFYTYFTSEPRNVTVLNTTALNPTVTWTAPPSTEGIAGYKIKASYTVRVGRFTRTYTTTFDSPGTATSFVMTGLSPNRNYKLTVQPYDAAGNVGLLSAVVNFTYAPAVPNLSWTFNPTTVIANQPMTVQFKDANPAPRTYALVSGPAGMTIDPTTGLLSWTPTLADVGTVNVTVRATNSTGPKDVTLTFPVYFTGKVPAYIVSRIANGRGTASWTPPAENRDRIAGYKVYLSWGPPGRPANGSVTYDVPASATSVEVSLPVRGWVVYHLTVRAYDTAGNLGAPNYQTFDFTVP